MNKFRNIIYILLPAGIAFYIIYPLLVNQYTYPISEYELYKSFMVNFIDTLQRGELPLWNEYVGSGHPALYFGHYPINQNTILYMLFGFNDFTSYGLTRFLNLTILLLSFIYACKYLRVSYLIALVGALAYVSVNFVTRFLITDTIGNLLLVSPLLMIFIVKVIDENKIRDILIFSLFYIFWLSGGHITYVYLHLVMLSLVYWIAIATFYKFRALEVVNLKKYILLYFVLFIVPLLAVLYQYYFIYDVISVSNRLKEGLIISPFEPTAWRQLIVSFRSSSYFWVGLFLIISYAGLKLLALRYRFIETKRFKIPLWSLLLLVPFLYGIVYSITNVASKSYGDNVVANGGFESNVDGWVAYKSVKASVPGGRSGNAIEVKTNDDAIGYSYIVVPTEIGGRYKFEVYFKKGTAANGQIKIGVEIDNTNLYYSGVLSDADWTQYNGSFQASTTNTYITLVNLTSVKNQTSFFDSVAVYKLKPSLLADYASIINSKVFLTSFVLYFLINGLIVYRRGFMVDASVLSLFNSIVIFITYVSLLSYYFYSPENIIGDVNGYDYDLFRELSNTLQKIFVFCILFSLRDFQNNKMVKITVISSVVLYLLRSHLTIPILRFTGIVWYATRDGTIFSIFFAILFMFGLKNLITEISYLLKNQGSFAVKCTRYVLLVFILILLVRDSFDKFYKGTSHRYIYPNRLALAHSPMEKWILGGREDIVLLNNKLLELDKHTKHFYRIFTPENSYLYLAGNLQQYKIHEAVIYESSISREFQGFYDNTIMQKSYHNTNELKNVMPYFLFTKHVHKGLNLSHKEIKYSDFFIFLPKDAVYLHNQNIEFLWDIMQVKYLIVGPEFSKALEGFSSSADYKLLGNYPKLNFNLYEITKDKSYSKLAVLPLEDGQRFDDLLMQLNSKDINILRDIYSKLVFLDRNPSEFTLLKTQGYNGNKYYEIDSRQRGILVDFESWNHNWELRINGENKKLQKTFHIFSGMEIKPGLNKIEMTYHLKYFKELFLLSVLVILIYVVMLYRCSYRTRTQ